jgi:predicted NBD/HSP70 family sugar kinase
LTQVAGATSAGAVLQLVRSGVTTRSDLARRTGMARSTVSQRVDALIRLGLVVETGDGPSTGGRPPTHLAFNPDGGVVVAADFGITHCRLAVANRLGELLAVHAGELDIGVGPAAAVDWAMEQVAELMERIDRPLSSIDAVGVGLPGPVEFAAGRVVNPPIMPGWDGVGVPPLFAAHLPDAAVLVDNDVNMMALGEYWHRWRSTVDDMLFVKIGTGIGCGIIARGSILHGAQGAAGDLGHVQIPDALDALCTCGNRGCVEAVAGGGAVSAALRAHGRDVHDARDVVALAIAGDAEALNALRTSGRLLGEVLAGAVNFFNPSVIVLGGDLADGHEQLIAGVREFVYRRSTALATRNLQIVHNRLGADAGVVGCAASALGAVLSAEAVDSRLARAEGTRGATA